MTLMDMRAALRMLLQQDSAALDEIWRVLPRRQAACIELIYYRDMTQEQAAEALGISDRTVRNDLHEALETLRDTDLLKPFPLFPGLPPEDD